MVESADKVSLLDQIVKDVALVSMEEIMKTRYDSSSVSPTTNYYCSFFPRSNRLPSNVY